MCPSQVGFLPRLAFLQLMRAHPDVSLRVAKHLSMEISKAWQQTRMLALAPDTHAKLTQFLFEWADKHGQATADGLRITLHMTHEEIARNIGSSRESVSRILSDWKQRGVIRVGGGSITIPRPKEFRETMAAVRSRESLLSHSAAQQKKLPVRIAPANESIRNPGGGQFLMCFGISHDWAQPIARLPRKNQCFVPRR